MTTNEYVRGMKTMAWPPFNRKLWQRGYYDRIIRERLSCGIHGCMSGTIQHSGRWTAKTHSARPHRPDPSRAHMVLNGVPLGRPH
jgi:hypothetical protein